MQSYRTKPRQVDNSLACSFCHKAQGTVGKLISSPSDYPRAYICDECIAVCNAIIEDDRPDEHIPADVAGEAHPLLDHPLTSEFLAATEEWIHAESLGGDPAPALANMRRLAGRMLQDVRK